MSLKSSGIAVAVVSFALVAVACGTKPSGKPTNRQAVSGLGVGGYPSSSNAIAGQGLDVQLADPSASLTFPGSSPIRLEFVVVGGTGRAIEAGLLQGPTGAQVVSSGSNVSFTWSAPTNGSHTIQFLLRDTAACQQAESSPSQCTLGYGASQVVTPRSYDSSSRTFTIQVGSGLGGGFGDGLGGGLGGGGGGGLLQQLLGAISGGGGGGGLQSLVQNLLSGGQLQGLLQNLNISQLQGLLQNIDPNQVQGVLGASDPNQLSGVLGSLQGSGGSNQLINTIQQYLNSQGSQY